MNISEPQAAEMSMNVLAVDPDKECLGSFG